MQDRLLQNLFNLRVTKIIPNFHSSPKSYTCVYEAYSVRVFLNLLAIFLELIKADFI